MTASGRASLGHVRHDLRLRIGQRHDQRLVGHLRQPFGLQHARGGKSQEDVGARQDLGQRARLRRLRVDGLVVVHLLRATCVHDAPDVGDEDILALDAETHEQVEARQRGRARARAHELHAAQFLADHAQAVQDRRADDDRRAVLVVVEDRDLHPLPAHLLDVEALRRFDVLEVDAAERRLQRHDHVHQLVRVELVDLDVEAVDARELLEQHRLALHHRLGGERADRSQAQHRGAVGDHADQVAARGEVGHLARIADDFVARGRDARRIGEAQVVLVGELLGRLQRDLPRRILPVVFEGSLTDVLVRHGSAA